MAAAVDFLVPLPDLSFFAGFLRGGNGAEVQGSSSSSEAWTCSTSSSSSSTVDLAPGFSAREEGGFDFLLLLLRLTGVSPGTARATMARLRMIGHCFLPEWAAKSRSKEEARNC